MKKLDVSAAVSGNILFTKSGHFDFLQLAYQEGISAAIIQSIGFKYDPRKVYILSGCGVNVSSPNTAILPGVVFCNGEIFIAPQSLVGPTSSGVLIANLSTTYYTINADPTDFSDGTPRNVCQIRQINFSFGVSGTGTFNGFGASTFNDRANFERVKDVTFFELGSFSSPESIDFLYENNRYYTNPITGANVIDIRDNTNFIQNYVKGQKVKFIMFIGAPATFSFTTYADQVVIEQGNIGFSTGILTIEVEYIGVTGGLYLFIAKYTN